MRIVLAIVMPMAMVIGAACSQQLSKEQIELIDAVAFVTQGLAEGSEFPGLEWEPTKRRVDNTFVEFIIIGKHTPSEYDPKELREKTADSRYVRFTTQGKAIEQCVIKFADRTEFSKGDSREDFSAHVDNTEQTLNLNNAHRFEVIAKESFDKLEYYVVLEGIAVFCVDQKGCKNKEEFSTFIDVPKKEIGQKPPEVIRRERAIAFIKQRCPGKPY